MSSLGLTHTHTKTPGSLPHHLPRFQKTPFSIFRKVGNSNLHSPSHKKGSSVQNYHVPGSCYGLGNVAGIRKVGEEGRWAIRDKLEVTETRKEKQEKGSKK